MYISNILKKSAIIMAAVLFLCGGIGAGNGLCEDDEVKVIAGVDVEDSSAIDTKNSVCPVSDDDIDKATAIKVEYRGRIYNLCCKACLEHFKKYPEKFSQKVLSPR